MKKPALLEISVGDRVLIGTPGTTMPRDWWKAVVLWIGPCDILVEQFGFGGTPHRVVYGPEMIRAIGDDLTEFQEQCCAEVKALSDKVKEAEQALGAARDAVWQKLDEIGASRPVRRKVS